MTRTLLAFYLFLLLSPLKAARRGNGRPKEPNNARNFNVTLNLLELNYVNPKYFGSDTTIKLHNNNEISFRYHILRTMPADTQSISYTFEKNSKDEYVPSITIRETVCDEFNKDGQRLPLYKCYRFHDAGIKECPFKKGIYSVSHAKCSATEFPPIIPGRYWRINRTVVGDDDVLLMQMTVDATIERRSYIGFT